MLDTDTPQKMVKIASHHISKVRIQQFKKKKKQQWNIFIYVFIFARQWTQHKQGMVSEDAIKRAPPPGLREVCMC